jgi:diguanylate cyclase (GGDEF)-like protein/putative nucleotidyltransferase with HDIG domain
VPFDGASAWLALPPILAIAWLIHRLYRDRSATGLRRIDELMRIQLSTIEALTLAIDAKDPRGHGHVRRVQAYALELARLLGVPRREQEALRAASLLHDIGTLAVPDYLLNKPGKLSDVEYQKVKVHPSVGAEILANVEFPYPIVPIIRHHHEHWDGSGYPDGLKGESIPIGARVLLVADAFEALTSDRAYQRRRSYEEACAIIESWSGIHFAPDVVHALRENLLVIVTAADQWRPAAHDAAATHASGARAGAAEGSPGAPAAEGAGDPGGFGDRLHRGVAPGGAPGPAAGGPAEAAGRSSMAPGGAPGPAGGPGRRAAVLSDISSAHREVYALYEIAQTLGSSLRLAEVLDLVVSKIGQLVPYATCAIYLLEDTGETLSARFVSGANADALRGRALRLGEGISGWAGAQKSNRFSTSPELDLDGTTVDPADYSTVAAFPLCHDNRILGVITLYFPKGIPCLDDHTRMMDIVAKLSAGAVFNATLLAESQESALTDDLTNLPNARYMRQVFQLEAIRCQQAAQPMAILQMDLDDFRTVNERFGHQAGDQYLVAIGRILRSHLRERDILVRLSSDEFGAILPLTGFAPAALLVERLQQAVELFGLRLEEGKVARCGLSAGIALYPQDGESYEDLLVRADFNMYQNKEARKKARLERPPNILPFPIKSPGTKGF